MTKKSEYNINHIHVGILAVASLLLSAAFFFQNISYSQADNENKGYDQFGYNYTARNFNGKADGVDRMLDGKVWGDKTYANDHLKMTWSKAWDDARFHEGTWNCEAWEDNQWNGSVKDGSGENWHYKIGYVGPELQQSACWREGGQAIWGAFEVIFSQGTAANKHFWEVHANPPGYGGF